VNDAQFSPEEQINIEQMLLNAGYDIDPDYFAQKYGIPITGRTSTQADTLASFFA